MNHAKNTRTKHPNLEIGPNSISHASASNLRMIMSVMETYTPTTPPEMPLSSDWLFTAFHNSLQYPIFRHCNGRI